MDRRGLLEAVEVIAKGRMIPNEMVFQAVEEAIVKALKLRIGEDARIRATVKRSSGEIEAFREYQVVEEVSEPDVEMTLAEAQRLDKDVQIGGVVLSPISGVSFTRNIIHLVKQIIVNKVREAEQERQYLEYKDRTGEIISGIVKRFEGGNVIIDLGHAEGVIPRQELIMRENLRYNERTRGYIYRIQPDKYLPPIYISRRHPQFVVKLFEQEVPEIESGLIKIVAIARDAGSRTKMVVSTEDKSINPVGTCIGIRGSRVNAVISELNGEKIDIINHGGDTVRLVLNALAPAVVTKVIIEEEQNKILVVVPESSVSLAIGPGGQNVRLTSQLVGKEIEILTEKEESSYQKQEMQNCIDMFCEQLDVDEAIGRLLCTEGFRSVRDIIDTDDEELLKIQGFNEALVTEIKQRCQESMNAAGDLADKELQELGLDPELVAIPGLNKAMLLALAEAKITTRDGLADLDTDELIGEEEGVLREFRLERKLAEEIIMYARKPWFEAEAQGTGPADEKAS